MGVAQTLLDFVQCCLPLGSHDTDGDEDERQPLLAQHGTYIVVLHHGRIVEQGSHEKLLASMGRYANLWATKEPYKQNETLPRYIDGSTSTECKSVTEHATVASPIMTPQRHRREGSKLNPDAPDFTPSALAAGKSQPSPFINRVETPTPAQRPTPLPENIALPPSVAPVARADFRFPLASPRRRFESKSETKDADSDECVTPRRVSAPSPSRKMRVVSRNEEKLGCGKAHGGEGPDVVKKTKPVNQDVLTVDTIKSVAAPTTKLSTSQPQNSQTTDAVNVAAAGQRGNSRPRGRFTRGKGGRRGGRPGNSHVSTEVNSGLPVPAKNRR
ncbi:hypothetical protein ACHAQH_000931 [Verticillium albo-atrum]